MTSAALVAPFLPDTASLVGASLRHVVEVEAVTVAGESIPLDVKDVPRLVWDESTAPRVQATIVAAIPDEVALDALDPRLGPRLRIRLGYARPGGVEDVHLCADLGIRTRRTSRPDDVVTLTAMSDEALVIDAGPTIVGTVSGASVPLTMRALIFQAMHPDPAVTITHPDATATSVVDVSDRWATVDDLADIVDADVYDTGLRTWRIEPRPKVAARAAAILKVGPGGTLTDTDSEVSRDGWANQVILRYRWVDSAGTTKAINGLARTLTGPYAVGTAPLRIFADTRDTPTTQAAANKAAAAVLARMLSRSRGFTLSAVACYWLRPGHTVTVQLPTGVQQRHLVSSVDFAPLTGRMIVTTRLPDTVSTIGE